MARTDSRSLSNACVRRAMKSLASSPLAITWLSIALNSATSVPGCIWRWTSARAASSVLRGSATMSVAPRSWARLIAAPKTGWDSVVFAPAMKMTSAACSTSRIDPEAAEGLRARCLADGVRRSRRLHALTFSLDGLPRTAAALLPLGPAPYPMPALLEPAPTDQRLGEAVVMLGEIVAEPTLHAGRALVRGVELDVRRGDPHDPFVRDVQVHLTPDTTVRAPRAPGALRPADRR